MDGDLPSAPAERDAAKLRLPLWVPFLYQDPSPSSLPELQAEGAGTTAAPMQGYESEVLPTQFHSGHAIALHQADRGSSAGTLAWMALSRVSACWRKAATSRARCRASWCSFRVPCSRSHLCGWKGRGEGQPVPHWVAVQSWGKGRQVGGLGGPASQPVRSQHPAQSRSACVPSTHILLRCLRRAEMLLLSLLPCFSSFWARLFSSLCRLWNCCSSWPKQRDRHQHLLSGTCAMPRPRGVWGPQHTGSPPTASHLLQVKDAAGELDLVRAFLQEGCQGGLLLLGQGRV